MEKIKIPNYTLKEELINAISHGMGSLLGIAGLVLIIVFSVKHHDPIDVVSVSVYGATMIIMYTISCLYHSLSPKLKAKKVFRILDHNCIYLFIAGTYTPYCLSLIGGGKGWMMFGVIWFSACIGIILNSINLEKYKIISVILYLVMGWLIIFSFNSIKKIMPFNGLLLLIIGGIIYTLGVIFYGIGSKKRYFHSIFHFFVLIASIFHFFSIIFFTL